MGQEVYIALGLGLWNLLTSVIVGLTMIMLKNAQKKSESTDSELMRQNILLNKTREELAREYITKTEVRSDMAQIINRFDRLEEKLDQFIETRK